MARKFKKRRDRIPVPERQERINVKPPRSVWSWNKTGITIFSILVLSCAYIHNNWNAVNDPKVENTLNGLLRAERAASVRPNARVAVGFGACQDVIVQSNQVLLDAAPDEPEHYFSISTRKELLQVFAYFYRHGAAAERFINNSTLFEELVEMATSVPNAQYVMGGNAPVMAKRFAEEGCEVLLGAQMTAELQKHLPVDVKVSGPTVDKDDVHLLLEYPAMQSWGGYVSPRANRFIIHSDSKNPSLSSLHSFSRKMMYFEADLLVVGGLQMMDNFPMDPDLRRERLLSVQSLLIRQPSTTRIHFEMASFSDETLMRELCEIILPYVDSVGMNEQELPNLYHLMMYGNVSLVAESYPRVSSVLDQMRDVYRVLQSQKGDKRQRRVTRIHVHTLAYQAIMIENNSFWKNTPSAAAKAALTANRHTCGSEVINVAKAKIIMDDSFSTSMNHRGKRIPYDDGNPVACWDEYLVEICVAPVLVCTKVIQTGGGGDNVSSAGLVLQI